MIYVYEGDKIKLNEKDFNKLLNMFQNINLRAELDILDMELMEEKKYWMPMMAKLRYRNNNAPAQKQYRQMGSVAYIGDRSTRDIGIHEELIDRSWADK